MTVSRNVLGCTAATASHQTQCRAQTPMDGEDNECVPVTCRRLQSSALVLANRADSCSN